MFFRTVLCGLFFITVASTDDATTDKKITSYDPAELLTKIFNPNVTISSRQRGYGFAFEEQPDPQTPNKDVGQYGLITFEENDNRLKFKDDLQNYEGNSIRFEEDSGHNNLERPLQFEDSQEANHVQDSSNQKRKKRRRRKPKKRFQNPQGQYQVPAGIPAYPGPVQGVGPNPYVDPGFPGPVPFKRRRRPRPSLASDALTAVTGALTSIALYDDYQCVPRLLCEAAGDGALANGALGAIAGIQPLLTLLSAYNGLSSSPLFVFGRAVFLGMTSKGNTGTCRYAYPQCPTDPEQLIHYLNNHNGGFFRFFNAPPNQNLEQFYNHLGQSGQGYIDQGQNGFGYGLDQNLYQGQGSYGLYGGQQGYGFQNNNQNPGLYGNQNYGSNYAYDYNYDTRFKDSKIQKRIQNKPVQDGDGVEDDPKWLFPDEPGHNTYDDDDDIDNTLKFPEESQTYDDKSDSTRKGKSILFPENQYNPNNYSNKKLTYPNYTNHKTTRPYYNKYNYNTQKVVNTNIYKYPTTTPFNDNDYYYDHKHNFYVKKDKNTNNAYNNYDNNVNSYNTNNQYTNYVTQRTVSYVNYNNYNNDINDGTRTVYIVRGNGDPSRPEIVKVRPGQTIE